MIGILKTAVLVVISVVARSAFGGANGESGEEEESAPSEELEEPESQPIRVLIPILKSSEPEDLANEFRAFAAGQEIYVDIEFFEPPEEYIDAVAERILVGEAPDLIYLTVDDALAIKTAQADGAFDETINDTFNNAYFWPVSCSSYFAVLPGENMESVFAVLNLLVKYEILVGPSMFDCDNDTLSDNEVWIPYPTPPGEDVIGQAFLMPGDPAIRHAIAQLEEILSASEAQINTARAVVLRRSAGKEMNSFAYTHLAPIGEGFDPDNPEDQTIAVIALDSPIGNPQIEAGVYAIQARLQEDQRIVSFIDPEEYLAFEEAAEQTPGLGYDDDYPTAGLSSCLWCLANFGCLNFCGY